MESVQRKTTAGGSAQTITAAALIIVATTICYSNSFSAPFVLDDIGAIVENSSFRDLSKPLTVLTGATHATVIGRPLLNLSLAINYAVSGTESLWDYHVVNLSLHLIAALLLFGIARRTLQLPSIPTSIQRHAPGLATAISLLWAVHPLQTESVTYIVQRAESMVAVFYFLSLYSVIRGATSTQPGYWYVTAVLSCAFGVASKEVIVTAPVVILFYDRIFLAGSFHEIRSRRWKLYTGLFANWIWLAILMSSSKGRSETAGFGFGMTAWDYAVTQFGFITRYLRLCFWPYPLVFDYGDPIARTPIEIIPYAAFIACLLLASIVALRYRPWAGFLGLSFFLILSPTSSIVPLVTQTVAEHRMYLPLACVVALSVLICHVAIERLARPTRHREQGEQGEQGAGRIQVILFFLIAVALGVLTYQRNADYQSALTLWQKSARDFPSNARAFFTIGNEYLQQGQVAQAIEQFNEAIRLRDNVFQPYYARGGAHYLSGHYELAQNDFRKAVSLAPNGSADQAQAYYQLGYALGRSGKHAEALDCFKHTLEINPAHGEAKSMIEKLNRLLDNQR